MRGFTRSGQRYVRQNLAYYESLAELKIHHRKLFDEELAVSTRLAKVFGTKHLLMQTTIRYKKNHLYSSFPFSLSVIAKKIFFSNPFGYFFGSYSGAKAVRIYSNLMYLVFLPARTPFNHPHAKENLAESFRRLFAQQTGDSSFSGFEVVVAFNAVLANKDQTSFSVFYGADFRLNNAGGAADNFRHKCKLPDTLYPISDTRYPILFCLKSFVFF